MDDEEFDKLLTCRNDARRRVHILKKKLRDAQAQLTDLEQQVDKGVGEEKLSRMMRLGQEADATGN